MAERYVENWFILELMCALFKSYFHTHCNSKVLLFCLPSLVLVDPYITNMYQYKMVNQKEKEFASRGAVIGAVRNVAIVSVTKY